MRFNTACTCIMIRHLWLSQSFFLFLWNKDVCDNFFHSGDLFKVYKNFVAGNLSYMSQKKYCVLLRGILRVHETPLVAVPSKARLLWIKVSLVTCYTNCLLYTCPEWIRFVYNGNITCSLQFKVMYIYFEWYG